MERIKIDINKYKQDTTNKRVVQPWQDYAAQVVKDFGIVNKKVGVVDNNGKFRICTTNYVSMIFRYAKNNMSYLVGKVELCKEKFGSEGLNGKGNYLISLFRKKKPWEK